MPPGDHLFGIGNRLRTASPDRHVTFDETLMAGDKTAIRWTMTGTGTGPLQGLPPTGQPVRLQGVAISRAVDGETVEVWQYYNPLGVTGRWVSR